MSDSEDDISILSDDESDFEVKKPKPKPKSAAAGANPPAKKGLAERRPNAASSSSPPAPKKKSAPAPKKPIVSNATPEKLDGDDEDDVEEEYKDSRSKADNAAQQGRTSTQKKQVSKVFQKKTQLEHILLRPDTYIGSVERCTQKLWVKDPDSEILTERDCSFVPGLYKIFDEILVNAADNKRRDSSMREMRVEIDASSGRISIRNDGKGIPVELHEEHGVYIPEMVFGHLLTGENFDDSEQRIVGGRNGVSCSPPFLRLDLADSRFRFLVCLCLCFEQVMEPSSPIFSQPHLQSRRVTGSASNSIAKSLFFSVATTFQIAYAVLK